LVEGEALHEISTEEGRQEVDEAVEVVDYDVDDNNMDDDE
jgi:hypothetical protein